MDRISSGIVDIICAQTRARAASDKLYETQRVQSGVSSILLMSAAFFFFRARRARQPARRAPSEH